jgi:hypothetical protein
MDSNELAKRLGISYEAYPILYRCGCNYDMCYGNDCDSPVIRIPMPDSNDFEACLWDPFLIRALGEPLTISNDFQGWMVFQKGKSHLLIGDKAEGQHNYSLTAALYMAWLAKEDLGNGDKTGN